MYLDDINSSTNEVIGLFAVSAGGGGDVADSAGFGKLVGVASLGIVLDEASVTSMAVLPAERGKGLGECLMLALMLVTVARQVCLSLLCTIPSPLFPSLCPPPRIFIPPRPSRPLSV